MTNDYASLIQTNPIIRYSLTGYQLSSWFNYTVTMNSSTKSFEIRVYANTPGMSVQLAQSLKQYLENRPVGYDNVSIGLRPPLYDPVSRGHMVSMVMNAGHLMVLGTVARCGGEFKK